MDYKLNDIDLANVPFVSIIIPTYNEEAYLSACLCSLQKLNYPPNRLEIIVVDNGSTDYTINIAKEYGALVHVKPELTISGLRNFGASISTANILCFVDADCEVAPDWISRALLHFTDNDVGCVGSTAEAPADGTWVQKTWGAFRTRKRSNTEADWLNSMNMIVRKAAFESVGGFDDRLVTCEDVDFCYRLKKYYTIIYDHKVKVIHHGEAKDLITFFKKEFWRGQSNITGLFRHGVVLRELPSIFLPVYYLALSCLFPIILVYHLYQGAPATLFAVILALATPPAFFAFWAAKEVGNFRYVPHYYVLFCLYSFARMTALIHSS